MLMLMQRDVPDRRAVITKSAIWSDTQGFGPPPGKEGQPRRSNIVTLPQVIGAAGEVGPS